MRRFRAPKSWFVGCIFLFYLFATYLFIMWMPIQVQSPIHFTITPGMSIRTVAKELYAQRVIPSPWCFELWARWKGHTIQSGEYLLTPGMHLSTMARHFARGKVYLYRVSFPEGWTFAQLWRRLEAQEALVQDITPDAVMAMLGHAEFSPEGQFYPDTYRFPRNTPVSHLLIRAHLLADTKLMEIWMGRVEDPIVKNPQALLTLASLIQKESAQVEELSHISGVLYTRLHKRMRLQVDPTVIYALGSAYTGTLSKADLKVISPYNTYQVAGLPPTPIGLVSFDALYAAAHPMPTEDVYYVARGDGSHVFSETLEAHQQAAKAYQNRGQVVTP